MSDVLLQNDNGVQILKSKKTYGHLSAVNALCHCGEVLLVAPKIFGADHQKGDPVLVCGDHGTHAFRFRDLVLGKQPPPSA